MIQKFGTQYASEILYEYRDISQSLLKYDATNLDTIGLQALINVTNKLSMLLEIWETITRISQ